jgi:CheY-like chemotaxis protein
MGWRLLLDKKTLLICFPHKQNTGAITAMAKILITEDEDSLRMFVARALRLDGHETHEAGDGAEGLEKLSEGPFDLLLSDIRMPVMDGIELVHQASARFPDLKILLMTGYAEQRERADDLAAKVIDVVQKPFALPDIRRAVASALATGNSRAA